MTSGVIHVAVTGGAGQIAYSLIPLLARGHVFGPNVRVHLRLLDIPVAKESLCGVAMEIQDSVYGLLDGVIATTHAEEAFSGAQVVILLGGFPRKPGMERRDLIEKNIPIMKSMGQALEVHACRDVKVLVVANPANTNCLVVAANAPSLPRENFTCLTRLDQDRLTGLLAARAAVPAAAVRGAIVWGNHSGSQVPDVSAAEVCMGGIWQPARHVIGDDAWLQGDLVQQVRTRGAAVIQARKLSSALSAANAIAAHLRDWKCAPTASTPVPAAAAAAALAAPPLPPPPESATVISMGVWSDGNPYGVPPGLVCSLPVVCAGEGRWAVAGGRDMGPELREQLRETVRELEEERAVAEEIVGSSLKGGAVVTATAAAVGGGGAAAPAGGGGGGAAVAAADKAAAGVATTAGSHKSQPAFLSASL